METIKEVIVVEGKNDAMRVKQVVNCDVFMTFGYHITKRKLALLKNIQKQRGLILLLDPDVVGEKIRKKINDNIENCLNAYIPQEVAKTSKKIGIEHAKSEHILKAIQNKITPIKNPKQTFTMQDCLELKLTNNQNAAKNRKVITDYLYLGNCNLKTLLLKLNILQITKQQVAQILNGGEYASDCHNQRNTKNM